MRTVLFYCLSTAVLSFRLYFCSVAPPPLSCHGNDSYTYARDSFLNWRVLGSDGTVSIWDKDARTRMKSKHLSPSLDEFLRPAPVPARASVIALPPPSIHSVLCLPFIHQPSPLTYTRMLMIKPSAFGSVPSPVVSSSFNHTGTIFAYAVAYDWSKGHMGNTPSQWNKVLLHGCKEDEVRKRPPKTGMAQK